ncbi:aromatic-ring-hydroxylating dioxygenase subunit beta [Escherichia coli]|uniref:aromatic-ring-hydroxylating dioxygenase subunit beta n=1 Tax=Escherichia coli TaxID=562 RepID=UPI00158077D1|nr:aromatic-ring-hydroxylating dioxygenase subunit beta [Escherichia coli]NUG44467.1 hypothetical protein [Escherichia coli]
MSAQVSLELHHRISQFLFHEASLLDDWKFRDWLAQLDEEIRYTMRTTVNAQTRDRRKGVQPPTTWIFNDTKDQLERRIARLEDDNWRLLERDIVLDQAVITSHNLSVLF